MKNQTLLKTFLFISAIIAIAIGASLLFFPVEFEASAGITIDTSASALSEVRSSGGLLLACGVLIFIGIFKKSMLKFSLIISALLYLAYGFSRILSIVLDGVPHGSILAAAVLEIIIGLISLFALKKIETKKN